MALSTAFDGDFSAGLHYRIFEQLRPDQIASITQIACKSSTLFPVQQSRHGNKREKLLRFPVISVTGIEMCKEAFFYNFKPVLFFIIFWYGCIDTKLYKGKKEKTCVKKQFFYIFKLVLFVIIVFCYGCIDTKLYKSSIKISVAAQYV